MPSQTDSTKNDHENNFDFRNFTDCNSNREQMQKSGEKIKKKQNTILSSIKNCKI